MVRMRSIGTVALGGTVGATLRWAVLDVVGGATFPWPVLLVNLVGCTVLGLLIGLGVPRSSRLLLGTGLCGGLTTFSTFSLQTLELIQKNDWTKAGANIAASVALCLLCTWAGWMLGQSLRKTTA